MRNCSSAVEELKAQRDREWSEVVNQGMDVKNLREVTIVTETGTSFTVPEQAAQLMAGAEIRRKHAAKDKADIVIEEEQIV